MTIARKLILSFFALAMLVALCAVAGALALHQEHGAFRRFVEQEGRRLALAHAMMDATHARALAARNIVLAKVEADRQREKALVDTAHARLTRAMAGLWEALQQGAADDATERQLLAAIQQVETRYARVALGIVEQAMGGQREAAVARMDAECRPLLEALVTSVEAYARYVEQTAEASVATSARGHRRSLWTIGGLLVVALLGAVVVGRLLVLDITRSLRHAVEVARSVAGGDLTVRPRIRQGDEVGELLAALRDMTIQLAGLVQRVRSGSDSMSVSSQEIAIGSDDLSRRTQVQAEALLATTAAMDQLGAGVESNAQLSGEATALAATAAHTAQAGGAAVDDVVKTMDGIADSAQRIAVINGVIDDLAFQTNILALNAAVEAARAGEHGRGFAVVAAEVRALARRSSEAAREIKALITLSVDRVEQGSRVVGEAGGRITTMVAQVREVAHLIGQIGESAARQSTDITSVRQALALLDEATTQNAALVEQSNASVESLQRQSGQLADAVSAFRLA